MAQAHLPVPVGILAQRFFNFAEPVWFLQNFARLWAVGRSHNSVVFHKVYEMCGAAIANAQAALQQGSRSFAELNHQAHGVLIKLIVLAFSIVAGSAIRSSASNALSFFFWSFKEFLLVLRLRLRAPELHHGMRLFFRRIRRVQPMHPRRSR